MIKLAVKNNLAEKVYAQIKNDIFDFQLPPGRRFSESEIAERMKVSRTPVREALSKLEKEGYLTVATGSGWTVKPFDFEYFENLYDLRVILELASVKKIANMPHFPDLDRLKATWLVPKDKRVRQGSTVARLDEEFHAALVQAAGNAELTRVHHDIGERIRIIRRLDFTQQDRIHTTYDEHALILRNLMRRRVGECTILLRSHIESSKAEVRKITLHKIHLAQHATGVPHAGPSGQKRKTG